MPREMLGAELAEGQSMLEALQALTMRVLSFRREEACSHVATPLQWGAKVADSFKEILAECDDAAVLLAEARPQVLSHE